jgi:hypothetical protein
MWHQAHLKAVDNTLAINKFKSKINYKCYKLKGREIATKNN